MVMKCVVCKKRPIAGDKSRSFHRFPKNYELRQKWISILELSRINNQSGVCSDHFEESCYHQTDGYTHLKRLLSTAVPNITLTKEAPLNIENDVTLSNDLKNIEVSKSEENIIKPCVDPRLQTITADSESCNDCIPSSPLTVLFKPTSSDCMRSNEENVSVKNTILETVTGQAFLKSVPISSINDIDDQESSHEKLASTSNKITEALQRKHSMENGKCIPTKKPIFRFKVGCTTMYFARKNFDSDETYNNFQKLIQYKNSVLDAERKKNSRKAKKIRNFKDLAQNLVGREASDAAEYLQDISSVVKEEFDIEETANSQDLEQDVQSVVIKKELDIEEAEYNQDVEQDVQSVVNYVQKEELDIKEEVNEEHNEQCVDQDTL